MVIKYFLSWKEQSKAFFISNKFPSKKDYNAPLAFDEFEFKKREKKTLKNEWTKNIRKIKGERKWKTSVPTEAAKTKKKKKNIKKRKKVSIPKVVKRCLFWKI